MTTVSSVRFAIVFITGFFLSTTHSSAFASDLDLIFVSELNGELTASTCDSPLETSIQALPQLAKIIAHSKEASLRSLVIGAGNLLGEGNLARFIMQTPGGGSRLSTLFQMAGIQLFTVGTAEISTQNPSVLEYLATSSKKPILSNVDCDSKVTSFCEKIAPSEILNLAGIRVGLISILPEEVVGTVESSRIKGIRHLPKTTVIERMKRTRADADVLVLTVEASSTWSLPNALSLLQQLEENSVHVDLVHITALKEPFSQLTLENGTVLFGSPQKGAGVTKVSLSQKTSTENTPSLFAITVSTLREGTDANTELEKMVGRLHKDMCLAWSKNTGPTLPRAISAKEFSQITLDVLREHTGADIAILPIGIFRDSKISFKEINQINAGAILSSSEHLIVSRVSGQTLKEKLALFLTDSERTPFLIRGLSSDQGELLVNGRPLLAGETYKVVSIGRLAQKKNGILPDGFWDDAQETSKDDIRTVVLQHLSTKKTGNELLRPFDLEHKPLWTTAFDIGIDLQSVTVQNPDASYDRPQLTRTPSLSYRIDAGARTQMDHPSHLFQLNVRGQYGQSWLYTNTVTTDRASPKEWIGKNTANLISASTLYSYRGFGQKSPYIPTPYTSFGLESEFVRPDNRDYTHFELSGTVGARLSLPAQIALQVGVGVRSEALANPSSENDIERNLARARFLLSAGVEMQKRPLVSAWGNAFLGEFAINYAFTDPQFLLTHELRGMTKLYIALKRPLYLTVGADLYLFQLLNQQPGVSLDVTLGLKVLFDRRDQMR